MSSLEDLLPEMAGVFAAQESALENCVAVLSTQLQNLGVDCSRHLHRVVTLESAQHDVLANVATLEVSQQSQLTTITALESSQQSLQVTIATLQDTTATLQQQNELLAEQHATQSRELAGLRELAATTSASASASTPAPAPAPVPVELDLSGFKATFALEMKTQTADVVQAIVTEQLALVESTFTQQMVASSERAFVQAQESEALFKNQVEMLEKKFEFLSKIKMEIKELNKRMEKQDQTIDDMRTGLALLAKSVGSDEIDDDDEAEAIQPPPETSSRQRASITIDEPVLLIPEAVTLDEPAEESEDLVVEEPLQEKPPQPSEEEEREEIELAPPIEEPVTVEEVEPTEDVALPSPKESSLPEEEEVEVAAMEELPAVEVEQQPEETPSNVESEIEPSVPEPESDTPPPSEPAHEEPMPETVFPVEEIEILPADSEPEAVTPPPSIASPRPPIQEVQVPVSNRPETPKSVDDSEDNTDNNDVFRGVPQLPIQHQRPSSAASLPTASSISTIASIRTRRQERTAKRDSRHDGTLDLSDRSPPPRIPLSLDEIRAYWMRIFHKIIQLKRLQSINGTSPERTLFRKHNLSMGARVKRLEETTGDLEDTLEVLAANLHNTGGTLQTLETLTQSMVVSSTTLDKKTSKLDDVQRMHAQSIVGMEEKFEALEAELRRMRHGARRDSAKTAAASAMAQMVEQINDLTACVSDHTKSVDDHAITLQKLVQADLPSLHASVQRTVTEVRAEVDFKTRAIGNDLVKAVETLRADHTATQHTLETQITLSTDALYRDLMVLTSANLVAAELAAKHTAAAASSKAPIKKVTKQTSPLEISVSLLHSIVDTFESDCRKEISGTNTSTSSADMSDNNALALVLLEKLEQFRHEVTKLKEQADKAATITTATAAAGESTSTSTSTTKGFEDHLVLICTNQLRTLEGMLVSQSHLPQPHRKDGEAAHVVAHVKDLVIQFRAVLFFLVLHGQLIEPPQQIRLLQTAHATIENKVTTHDFALSQFATVEAVVKMMNSRLDAFLDMSFSFAQDADVKKSIQDMFEANEEMRESLMQQVDQTHGEAVTRDTLIEREIAQLAGRVQKKLDKDEMLWTQEVLERQLQNVAKGALGEDDLVDIRRALHAKMDKTQFQALLLQHHAKLQELHGGNGNGTLSLYTSGGGGNQPLAATRCISCDGELPPSTSQMRAAVKEEVVQEVAKALAASKHAAAASSSSSSASSPAFHASNLRSMDKHKRELLLSALQQQRK